MKLKLSLISLSWIICLCVKAQVVVNPVFDKTDTPEFRIVKVEITKDTTFVYCIYQAEEQSWANISKETILRDCQTDKKYRIYRSVGIPLAPEKKTFLYARKQNVILCFPHVAPTLTTFDIIESNEKDGFNIYGIDLKHENDSSLYNYSIEHAVSLSSKADFFCSTGNFQKAIEYEEQALYIKKAYFGRTSFQYAESVINLSSYYNQAGNYKDAIIFGEKGLTIKEKLFGKESLEYSMSLHDLAPSYAAIGDIGRAISLMKEALVVKSKIIGKHNASYVISLNNLASFYSMKDDYEKACEIESEALQLSEVVFGSNHPEYFKIIGNLGGYYLRLGRNEEAVEMLEKTCQFIKQYLGEDSEAYATALSNLSFCYSQLHDYNKSIEYGSKALNIIGKDNPQYHVLLSNLASYYAGLNDYKNVIYCIQRAISSVKEEIYTNFPNYNSEWKYLFWQNNHSLFDDQLPSCVAKYKNDSTLSYLYNNKLFSKGIVLEKKPQSSITWKDVQSHLQDDDIAIEFISPSPQMNAIKFYALTIKKGEKSPKMVELFDNGQFVDSLKNADSKFDKNKKVANLVWKPLEEQLKGVKNIYFSPTHILHSIPIEYLPIDSTCCYSDIYEMYRLSSTKELVSAKKNDRISKVVLYGGLEYEPSDLDASSNDAVKRSGFDPLPNTAVEISDISKILQKSGSEILEYRGVNGTEMSLRNLSTCPIDILHIATHGKYINEEEARLKSNQGNFSFIQQDDDFFYQSNALTRSFLVMSNGNYLAKGIPVDDNNDGIVTALDISNLDFSHIDIVVLSACESALGEFGSDDGLLGLQRGFKIAGANTILMSLNKVDDEATRILMVEFYKNLMAGKSKHQSLKEAQKHLRQIEGGKYNDPKYWAPFIMLDGNN